MSTIRINTLEDGLNGPINLFYAAYEQATRTEQQLSPEERRALDIVLALIRLASQEAATIEQRR